MAISKFQNLEFSTPKISKKKIFGKTVIKSFFRNLKIEIDVIESHVYYVHARF